MKLSENGLRLIQSFEGYHDRLPDGRCKAYQRQYKGKLDVPTIGFGCTVGVLMGMTWTRAEADAAFSKELERFERCVIRLVTVEMNQNEFDSMVSLAYNIGEAGFAKSSVLSRLNKGDRLGAANAFEKWNKVGKFVEKGLTSRRKREAANFLKPVVAPEVPSMPQSVSPPTPIRDTIKTVAPVAAGGVAVVEAVQQVLPVPSVPQVVSDSVTNLTIWQSVGQTVGSLKGFAFGEPYIAGALAFGLGAVWLGPMVRAKFKRKT